MRRLPLWQQVLAQLGLAVVGLFVIIPIWAMARLALDEALTGAPLSFRLWPEHFSLQVFADVWASPQHTIAFPGLLRNSLLIAGGAALTAVIAGTTVAYAFARMRFPGQQVGLFGLLLGTLLPQVALLTPLYVLLTQLGIRASPLGLITVYTAFSMPFCIWTMRAAFQAIPRELEEAALLEGAGALVAFRRIMLPLAAPAIAVAALLTFLVGYTEFAIGWLFIERGENATVAMAVSGLMSEGLVWNQISALSLLMSAPVVVVFLVLRRLLLRGLLYGSIEG